MFDPTPLVFYGIVCATLTAFVPRRFPLWIRSAIGGSVGIGAALLLPVIRSVLGV